MKNKNLLILLVFAALAVSFYWFQIRPSRIRSSCGYFASTTYDRFNTEGITYEQYYDFHYKKCLNERGLK